MATPQTQTALIRFEVGDDLATRSFCDWDCVFRFTVLRRTAKTITLLYFNEERTCRIKISERDGREYVLPLGNYSMSPILFANSKVENV
jgi:hypothetical protein